MSKFCGNCGTQLDDEAKVCGNCGMPYKAVSTESSLSKITIPGVSSTSPEQKKKVQNIVKFLIIAIIAVLIISVIGSVIVSSTGYRGTIKKMMNAYEEYDGEAMEAISSDFMIMLVEDDYNDPVEGITNLIYDTMDDFEQSVGDNIKFSYDITDTEEIAETTIKRAVATWEESNYEGDDIEKAVEVSLKVKIKGSDDVRNQRLTITLLKESDGWKIGTSDWLEDADY